MTEIGLFEAIYSARSLRRLKPDPVPEQLITKILDAAIRAPSGGNAQNWAFIVVRDPEQRRKLGMIYRKASDIAEVMYAARGRPAHLTEQRFTRMMGAGAHLEHDRREPHALNRIPHGGTFVGQLLERRADENSHALVRGSDGHHHHNHRTNRRPLGSTLFHAHAVPWPRNAPTLHGRGLS